MTPLIKYGLYAAGSGLWVSGLVGQLDSVASAGKYLAISALMAVVTLL